VENQPESSSPAASELKDEDEDTLFNVKSSRSMVINDEAMTIRGNSDEDLNLTPEQKRLVDF
jgi:hypothetical protein